MYLTTNVSALFAEQVLAHTNTALTAQEQALATGLTSPTENPSASMASTFMTGNVGMLSQNAQNIAEGIDALNIANGAVQSAVGMVQQLEGLAVQASSTTTTSQDRADIQHQVHQLLNSLDALNSTQNNGTAIFSQAPHESALNFYYGAVTPTTAQALSSYGTVVLGSGELPTPNTYWNSTAVHQLLTTDSTTAFYGYVQMSTGANAPVPMASVIQEINSWKSMGVKGIFLDDAGNAYGITAAARQQAVAATHAAGLKVTLNAWNPINDQHVGLQPGDAIMAENWYQLNPSQQIYPYNNPVADRAAVQSLAAQGVGVWAASTTDTTLSAASVAQAVQGINRMVPDVSAVAVETSNYGGSSNDATPYAWIAQGIQTFDQTMPNGALTIQSGPRAHAVTALQLPNISASALGLAQLNFYTTENSQSALTAIHKALGQLTTHQASLGSQLASLQTQASAISTMAANLQSSAATLQDANMAQITSAFSRKQVLAQMDLQMLVHADAMPTSVLAALSHAVPIG